MLKSVAAGLLGFAPLWLFTGFGLDAWKLAGAIAAAGAATGPAVRALRRHPAAVRLGIPLLITLGVEAAGAALLVFGIRQLGNFQPTCDPRVEQCVVTSGGGTPMEVFERQRDDYTRATWLIILVGAGITFPLPAYIAIGIVNQLRPHRPHRARRPFPDYLYEIEKIEETDGRDSHSPD